MYWYVKRTSADDEGNDTSTWAVMVQDSGDPKGSETAVFETEDDAAAWVSYLSGGGEPSVTPTKAREALEAKAKKAEQARAQKLAQQAAQHKAETQPRDDSDDHGRRAAGRR